MVEVGSLLHVRKLKPDRALDFAWEGVVVRLDNSSIVLRAEFNVDLVEREFATFRRGDVFFEFYFFDRWFNVFEIRAADGARKGWYANVGLPAELKQDASALEYVDLALDVWTRPDGGYVVLDQAEFDALLSDHADLAEGARRGRDELLDLVISGRLPRWDA